VCPIKTCSQLSTNSQCSGKVRKVRTSQERRGRSGENRAWRTTRPEGGPPLQGSPVSPRRRTRERKHIAREKKPRRIEFRLSSCRLFSVRFFFSFLFFLVSARSDVIVRRTLTRHNDANLGSRLFSQCVLRENETRDFDLHAIYHNSHLVVSSAQIFTAAMMRQSDRY